MRLEIMVNMSWNKHEVMVPSLDKAQPLPLLQKIFNYFLKLFIRMWLHFAVVKSSSQNIYAWLVLERFGRYGNGKCDHHEDNKLIAGLHMLLFLLLCGKAPNTCRQPSSMPILDLKMCVPCENTQMHPQQQAFV